VFYGIFQFYSMFVRGLAVDTVYSDVAKVHCALLASFLTLSLAAIKKSIEWRLQVQIAFLTEVNLAPSCPE
jgi:hypothetical protein